MKNMSKRTRTLFISIAAPLTFVLVFAIVVIVYNSFYMPPQVDVTTSGFVQQGLTIQSITINEGESINFVNHSSTALVLCLGSNQQCDSVAVDPAALAHPGMRLAPGEAKAVVFGNFGTFFVTCTTVPHLDLTITVNQAV